MDGNEFFCIQKVSRKFKLKVLLIGEYSGVHTNLTKALREKGYNVLCIHNGDGYKDFNADNYIKYNRYVSKNNFINFLLRLYYRLLTYVGLKGVFQIFKYRKILNELKGYDIVQLINPIFLSDFGFFVNYAIFIKLKKHNRKIFMCALGDDYYWVKCCLSGNYKYTMFDRLSFKTLKNYSSQLLWVFNPLYIFLNKYILNKVNAVIPGLFDYYVAYSHSPKCSKIVPIIMQSSDQELSISYPLKIFHGWQFGKEYRKGNDVIDEVFTMLKNKYPNMIDYEVIGGLPYSIYIEKFNSCHIFVDQCYSYDCGVNGLLGMSYSKVVLSGMEEEVKRYYNLDYEPLVNITPNKDDLFKCLEDLIKNPKKMEEYSVNARKFIEKYHSSDYVLDKYEEVWSKY